MPRTFLPFVSSQDAAGTSNGDHDHDHKTPTATQTRGRTATPTRTPTPSATPRPSSTPAPSKTPAPKTSVPTRTATATRTATPAATATAAATTLSPTNTPSPTAVPSGSQRIAIDPITRTEGHLRIEVQIDNGRVSDAWSSGTSFRGMELVLQGRDPRDAWAFTQRICGVCTTVHAIASLRAVENALGIISPTMPGSCATSLRASNTCRIMSSTSTICMRWIGWTW